jgi:hypothetical protein
MHNRFPSIVPPSDDREVYLVLDDFGGRIGQTWRETGIENANLETVLTDLLDGQYGNPVRVIGFNAAEGWSRDVSEDVAYEAEPALCRTGARSAVLSGRIRCPLPRDTSRRAVSPTDL